MFPDSPSKHNSPGLLGGINAFKLRRLGVCVALCQHTGRRNSGAEQRGRVTVCSSPVRASPGTVRTSTMGPLLPLVNVLLQSPDCGLLFI